MINQQSGSTTRVNVTQATAMTMGLLAASFMPTFGHPTLEYERPIIAFKTASEGMNARFKSEVRTSENIASTLQRLVNYFLEEEPAMSAELALTSRKHFREMYVRF